MALIAHYKLNDNSATTTTVLDSSGNEYHGTAARNTSNTYYASGKINAAFDASAGGATTDKINCGSNFIGVSALTICCWVYMDSWPAHGLPRIVDNAKVMLWGYSPGGVQRVYFSSDGNTTGAYAANNSLPTGAWQHIAVTRTTDGTCNFIINGVASGTADQSSGTPEDGSTTNVFLANRSAGDRNFDGRLDDFRFYNEVLTVSQIQSIYNNGIGTEIENTLAAHYRLDDLAANTVVLDTSGNGNNGTCSVNTNTAGFSVPAVLGTGFQFNGSNHRVSIPVKPNLSTHTISLWFKRLGDGSAPTVSENLFNNYLNDGTNERCYIYTTNTSVMCNLGKNDTAITLAPVTANWTHLTISRSSSTAFAAYINGSLVDNYTNTAWSDLSATSYIGGSYNSDNYFNGIIDDVLIFDVALTAQQILDIYNNRVDLVAHYKLNDATATTISDSSGNGNTAAAISTTSVIGMINSAAHFDGTNSYIDCGDPAQFRLQIFTICAWVRSDRATGTAKYWSIAGRGSIYDLGYGIHFYDRAGDPRFEIWIRNSTNYKIAVATTNSIDEWNHVAATCDGTNIKIYVSGSYVTQTAQAGIAPDVGANPFRIGDDDNASAYKWLGDIDDVRLYATALTDSQISAIYNGGVGTELPAPWNTIQLASCELNGYTFS